MTRLYPESVADGRETGEIMNRGLGPLSGSRLASLGGWAAAALVVLLPLVFLPTAFGPFHSVKWLVVLVVVPTGLALCAAGGMLQWPRPIWFLAWIAVSVAATVFGVAPWMSVFGSPNRNAGLLAVLLAAGAFVLGSSIGADGIIQRRVLRAAMIAGGVVGALAVAERMGLDIAGLGDVGEVTRARSTWGSATFAGSHLVLVAPIAIAHLRSRDSRWRIVAMVCTIAMAAGLVATGTRGAWLAAAVAAVIMAPAWRATRRGADTSGSRDSKLSRSGGQKDASSSNSPRPDRPKSVAIWVSVTAAVVVAGIFMVPQLGRSSALGRIDLWSTTPSVIADRPVLGSGPDTQRVVLPAGIDESFERDHGSEELHDRAHSLPLDTLVTTGILGLLALGGLLVVLGRDIAGALRRKIVPTAIAAGLAAYLVTLLFAFGDPVIDPIAWLLAGLLWVAIVPGTQTDHTTRGTATEASDDETFDAETSVAHASDIGRSPSAGVVGSRPLSVSLAVALAALSILVLVWGGREVLAEQHLQTAMDLRAAGDTPGALDELESAAHLAPARFDFDQIASRLVTQSLTQGPSLGSSTASVTPFVDDAFDRLDRAQRVAGTDDPDVLMDRAELLTASGDPRAALETYNRVLELYPQSFRAHLGIGLAASELNQFDEAEDAWSRAATLAPGDSRALVNLGILHERRGVPDKAMEAYRKALNVDPANTAAEAGIARVTAPAED